MTAATYSEWCRQYSCNHAHCPARPPCEHPQPFMFDGRLVCGRCFFKFGEVVEMVPCTPETCGAEA